MFYIVSTPIGNLEDITLRAIEVLRKVDFILCEDTRVTSRLLQKYEIRNSLKSYRQNQRHQDLAWLEEQLAQNKNIAFVSDAGTPGISDPCADLVRLIREKNLTNITVVPGPSALATALALSGWKSNPTLFTGFLSIKAGARQRYLKSLENFEGMIILYESVHRIKKLILEIKNILPNRHILICRELTKMYEEVILIHSKDPYFETKLEKLKLKGEFTLVLSPYGFQVKEQEAFENSIKFTKDEKG